MILYRYRNIERALSEIDDGVFYFATHNELNDPIEGYVKVFWQGDKFAWEGLLRNYIHSLSKAIIEYFLECDIQVVHKERSDNSLLEKTLNKIEESFFTDDFIKQLVTFYGQINLKISENSLRFFLYFVHLKALKICISKYCELNILDRKCAKALIMDLSKLEIQSTLIDKMRIAINTTEKNISNTEIMNIISKVGVNFLDDYTELVYIKLDFFSEKANSEIEIRQRKNHMTIFVDFPKLYINQLKFMIYPETFVACFSENCNNSVMWGNYSNNHKGVCLIYETNNDDSFKLQQGRHVFNLQAKPVLYEGSLLERNFFETFGCLTLAEVKKWLTGADGTLSSSFNAFKDENQWRNEYWKIFEMKTYHKLKAWEYEKEYRLSLMNTFYVFSNKDSRKFKYDPKCLRGVIFGINTSEYDKKQIMDKLKRHKNEYGKFTICQAEFDEETQAIVKREKQGWKIY